MSHNKNKVSTEFGNMKKTDDLEKSNLQWSGGAKSLVGVLKKECNKWRETVDIYNREVLLWGG